MDMGRFIFSLVNVSCIILLRIREGLNFLLIRGMVVEIRKRWESTHRHLLLTPSVKEII